MTTPQHENTPFSTEDKTQEPAAADARTFSFWQESWLQARLVWRLLRDPVVPFYLKLIPAAAVLYLFMPLDLLPDALLGLGQIDDLGLLLIGAKVFIEMVPDYLVEEHRLELEGKIVAPAAQKDGDLYQAIVINKE